MDPMTLNEFADLVYMIAQILGTGVMAALGVIAGLIR